ncbi:MAG: S1C family serine protease [Actinomycetales bacterium]
MSNNPFSQDPQPGSAPGQPQAPVSHPSGAPYPGPQYSPGYSPGYGHTQTLPTEQEPPGPPDPAMPGPPAGPPPGPARERRRPGWGALALATVGAAVLASGLTAGALSLVGDTGTAPSPTSSSSQTSSAQPPVVTDGTLDWNAVATAVTPSVVAIRVSGPAGSGAGSGVIIDDQGHVLTNNHVATGAGSNAQLEIVLSDGRVFSNVRVVGLDAATDLAVLQIADPPSDLTPATLGDSSKVAVGQPVMAVGNPLGLAGTVTTGIVSAVDRPVITSNQETQQQSPFGQQQTAADQVVTNAIQTDAAVNPGNSGGALVDAGGSVIGIPSSIASMSDSSGQAGSIGLGFAIPSNEAKRIADELIADGTASHAYLGVTLSDGEATADGTARQGATIREVVAGTPAQQAGLQAQDTVVSIDGEPVSGAQSLTAQVRERAPGDDVTLGVIRQGTLTDVSVTLGSREDG